MTDQELTRLLAVKVMGWGEGMEGSKAVWLADGGRLSKQSWWPLESIIDAWEVRDRLAEHGTIEVTRCEDDEWVDFTPYVHDGPFSAASLYRSGHVAPRVICLAALRAMGIDPEDDSP